MASHHHHHPNPAVAADCCRPHTCCCHPPPPPPQQTHLYPSCHQYPSSQVDLYHHLELEAQSYPPPPIRHSQQQFIHLRRKPTPEETHPSVSSLIRRIAALESSLLRHRLSSAPVWNLRDIAARTIQTHFRAFLARRSRTLSQLKELASIKSALHSLKDSTSGNAQFDPKLISRKSMALLQKLESIQGGDPMIRDGKRSINRDLIRFMDLIDRVCFKRVVRSTTQHHRGNNNSRVYSRVDAGKLSEDGRELRGRSNGPADKTRRFVGGDEEGCDFDIGDHPVKGLLKRVGGGESKVKKTVTFADDNGKLYRATIIPRETNSSGEEDDDDEIELVDNLDRKLEAIEGGSEEDEAELEEEDDENYKDDLVFSAPLPVKMDRRGDLMKKMKRNAAGNENR
ncbi:BAG family molecular chaperone regulator 8, chloroplastic [Impatiens glandulifera]|uniref:BAG family molecular chaperone regulator 8, chloroplastic n=1 Tax=Impatiens glandulifera TaxID=253017 RepID=UPI001FB0F503|nr:BAG family molecular chaperone regulator 8, chloroplastic [Impatiens glandulifera]